jgi:hypothetical protein
VYGVQFSNSSRSSALANAWKALGIHNLRLGHFIRVGQLFYGPEEAPSCHTLSGQEAMDVWANLCELRLNQDGIHNVGSAAGKRCFAPGVRFDSVLPWVPLSLVRRRTMEGGGRCVASWRCADTRDGAAARWTSLWSGRAIGGRRFRWRSLGGILGQCHISMKDLRDEARKLESEL